MRDERRLEQRDDSPLRRTVDSGRPRGCQLLTAHLEDLVDVVELLRSKTHGEVEESNLEVQDAREIDRGGHPSNVAVENVEHIDVGRNTAGLVLCKKGEPVHQRDEYSLDVDAALKLPAAIEDLIQSPQMIFVRKDLDDAFHEVLLSNLILAIDDLLEDPWKHHSLVHVAVHALKVAQPHKVDPNQNTQVKTLLFPTLTVPDWPLVLHPHPQFVHLGEVEHQKVNTIRNIVPKIRPNVRELITSAVQEVVAQEEPSHGVLDPTTHLNQVLQNVARRNLL
mmetsp:Transcript_18110/g.43994  ORF Transcript_18110/g.43994 Transcript_18110/m.43994 type:complete len:279 (-) Transcript_18110:451-1287(-)